MYIKKLLTIFSFEAQSYIAKKKFQTNDNN